MAANITFNSITGLYEVMTRGAAWHKLGQVVEGARTWQETMTLAGLDWTISKRQLSFNGVDVPAWGIFRDDVWTNAMMTGATDEEYARAFIAPATEGYEIIQNRFMFQFLDTMIEADGKAHYESAGSLNGGAQVFAMVNLGVAFEILGGDRYEQYLVFLEDRTGKRAAKCFITTVRVVCANTFEMAYSAADDAATVKFTHRKNVATKMAEAAGMFTGARMTTEILQDKLRRLADRTMTKETLMEVLDRLFPAETEKAANSKRREQNFLDVLSLFENNDGNAFPETRGTAYNLLNAVTEYVDHFSTVRRTDDKMHLTDAQIRAERAMFGAGVKSKSEALDAILEITAHNPSKGRVAYSMPDGSQVLEAVPELSATAKPKYTIDDIFAATK